LSVDDEAATRQTIAEHGLDFPVGHSADADAIAAATGAFVNDEPRYLQFTRFVLDREGGASSASTPAARSAGSCPTTSSASSSMCAGRKPRRRRHERRPR
jgi:peroxiredoxin